MANLFQGLKKLAQIKPNLTWREKTGRTLSTKLLFLVGEPEPEINHLPFLLKLKPVLAFLFIFALLFSGISFYFSTLNSLPGQDLYSLKKGLEKARIGLSSDPIQRTVLKAELLTKRLKDLNVLTKKTDSETSAQYAPEFHQELIDLNKEIMAQIDVTQDLGSLPIEDGRKILSVIQKEEFQKLLEEAKSSLEKKNFSAALEKTLAAEKMISQKEATSTPEVIEESKPKNKSNDFKIDSKIEPLKGESFQGGMMRE